MKDLYGLLVLDPKTLKPALCKAWFVKLTDANEAAQVKAKKYNTKVWIVRCVEVING